MLLNIGRCVQGVFLHIRSTLADGAKLIIADLLAQTWSNMKRCYHIPASVSLLCDECSRLSLLRLLLDLTREAMLVTRRC